MDNFDVILASDEPKIGSSTIEILLECNEKGKNLAQQHPPSIYMVPSLLRDLSPSSFTPDVVSIGPLHKEDRNVQRFEEEKAIYLHHLLNRLETPPEVTLEACVQKVNASIDQIRECYADMKTYDDTELSTMMVMDGCFILEFLYPSLEHEHLIFAKLIPGSYIIKDLLLLENQIPFFVLQEIFELTLSKCTSTNSLTTIVLESFNIINPIKISRNVVNDNTTHDHILGVLQKSFHPKNYVTLTQLSIPMPHHSALEMDKAGVNFKPNEDENWQMAIKFTSPWFARFCLSWSKPTLSIPVLHIHDLTELFLRNLTAYEQCTPHQDCYVSSYVCAMDMLVDTLDDIAKLAESKVLVNGLVSNEVAANMINNVSKNVVITTFPYEQQWQQMDRYYNSYWPRNIAHLRLTYFSNPWTSIALLAGVVLFTLTVIQTIYAIKAA